MGRLDAKVAVVVGGGRNLGRAMALTFAAEGASVCVVGRSLKPLQAAVDEIESTGGTASCVTADMTSPSEIDRMITEVVGSYRRIDVLVNSAGIFLNPTLFETTESDWDQIMDVNLKSVFFSIQKIAPVMVRQGGGSIINLASVMGVKGKAGSCVYCTAKAGVINMTRALALELGDKNIRVNAIAPGFTLDPAEDQIPDSIVSEMTKTTAVGRPGTAREIAGAAVYLASEESSFTTGTTIFVDGGETAR